MVMTSFLEREGIEVINPFRDVEQNPEATTPRARIYHIMQTEMKIIPTMDALVVIETDSITRGVHMEAFLAYEKGLPVIVLWLASDRRFSWYEAFATICYDSNEILAALRAL